MLWTLIFFFLFFLTLVLLLPLQLVGLVFQLVGLWKLNRFLFHLLGRYWGALILWLSGSKVEVSGLENIPMGEGVCFVGNHPSETDILVALSLIPRPFGFTAKKEARVYPFIGLWVWLLGGVFIDRKSPRKAGEAIRVGAQRIRKGGAMLIYPEGTRTQGEGISPFRPGAFKLATLSDSVIVPMATSGTAGIWEARHRISAVHVKVAFGRPIETRGLSMEERKGLSEKAYCVLLSLLTELEETLP